MEDGLQSGTSKSGDCGLALSRPATYVCDAKGERGVGYKRIMAITGHSTFAVFQDYNNPSDEDIKEVVSGAAPRKIVG